MSLFYNLASSVFLLTRACPYPSCSKLATSLSLCQISLGTIGSRWSVAKVGSCPKARNRGLSPVLVCRSVLYVLVLGGRCIFIAIHLFLLSTDSDQCHTGSSICENVSTQSLLLLPAKDFCPRDLWKVFLTYWGPLQRLWILTLMLCSCKYGMLSWVMIMRFKQELSPGWWIMASPKNNTWDMWLTAGEPLMVSLFGYLSMCVDDIWTCFIFLEFGLHTRVMWQFWQMQLWCWFWIVVWLMEEWPMKRSCSLLMANSWCSFVIQGRMQDTTPVCPRSSMTLLKTLMITWMRLDWCVWRDHLQYRSYWQEYLTVMWLSIELNWVLGFKCMNPTAHCGQLAGDTWTGDQGVHGYTQEQLWSWQFRSMDGVYCNGLPHECSV